MPAAKKTTKVKKVSVKKSAAAKSLSKVKTKKTAVKKTVAKKSARKFTAKRSTKAKPQAKKVSTKKDRVVSLPKKPTDNMVKKAANMRSEHDALVHRSVYIVTYVSAFCFMLVGAAFALSGVFTKTQVAQLASTTTECPVGEIFFPEGCMTQEEYDMMFSAGSTTEPPPPEPPLFDLISTINPNFDTAAPIKFFLSNSDNIKAFVKNEGTGQTTELPVNQIATDKYETLLDPAAFEPNYYVYKVYAHSLDGSGYRSYYSNTFFMGSVEEEALFLDPYSGETNLTVTDPTEFSVLKPLPQYVDNERYFEFILTNAIDKNAFVRNIDTQATVNLTVENVDIGMYRVLVDPINLEQGYYRLHLSATPLDGSAIFNHRTPTFFSGSSKDEELYLSQTTTETSTSSTTSSGTSGSTSGSSGGGSGSGSYTDTTTSDTTTSSTTTPVETIDKEVLATDDPLISTEDPVTTSESEFRLKSRGGDLTKTAVIDVETNVSPDFIELYARPANSLTPKFVTLAIKRDGLWRFVFDSNTIPNGKYVFTASMGRSGKIIKSDPLTLQVYNEPLVTTTSDTTTTVSGTSGTTETVTTSVSNSEDEVEEVFDEETESEETDNYKTYTEDVATVEAKQVLTENSESLKDLMNRYSIAVQSGDTSLIQAVSDELEVRKQELSLELLNRDDSVDIADEVGLKLAERIEVIKERVKQFEQIKKERDNEQSTADSDGDGISDFDERNIYRTDPNVPDSDNDGINDGVEIVQGFDPTSEKAEAVMVFESPKDLVGLERNDVLRVDSVTPVEKMEEDAPVPPVRAEIRGKALPNSFVTLYIYSTPTVVTVKTDADGSFVYTFDKELEDGEHDVYVAVTDNTGSVIAHSQPFKFVKEARAFTPVDAEEGPVVLSSIDPVPEDGSFKMVIGVAVLALGLILLMLGVGLKTREEDDEGEYINEDSSTEDTENDDSVVENTPATVSQTT